MNRIDHIRKEEKAYHDFCYDNYTLFEDGSWLHKPVSTVVELLPLFASYKMVNVLDLGSGVGRNSIPIAEWIREADVLGKVVCVDLLDSATEKLRAYAKQFHVSTLIEPIKSTIESYYIKKSAFDFIVAVSSLEHVETELALHTVLKDMAAGTKSGGINCIIINSDLEEIDVETSEKLDVRVEVNLSTEQMNHILENNYKGWTVLKSLVKQLEYKITRGEREILLRTKAITYVVKNN
ncbi:class I SAM-dependent methyltransferase [Ornithinibacillus bavariensis]|uniref:Methyltransferase n=1 Tax=Ornithinibacillus bavariensis TaxID=545502 RepID=A0A919X4J2_9BACI|nr:class I SAM-dependent methyltransferase [Ornithinibacillus bavariensis]GIO25549.1 methyltransferase [Ornithinibacillus bavariensis]